MRSRSVGSRPRARCSSARAPASPDRVIRWPVARARTSRCGMPLFTMPAMMVLAPTPASSRSCNSVIRSPRSCSDGGVEAAARPSRAPCSAVVSASPSGARSTPRVGRGRSARRPLSLAASSSSSRASPTRMWQMGHAPWVALPRMPVAQARVRCGPWSPSAAAPPVDRPYHAARRCRNSGPVSAVWLRANPRGWGSEGASPRASRRACTPWASAPRS